MKVSNYNINLEEAAKEINEKNYKKILLQLPEGLKIYAADFVNFLENKTDAEFIVYADPCFGACDIVASDIKDIGVDFIVQIGHLPILSLKNTEPPTMFINASVDFDVEKLIKKVVPKLDSNKIGLVSTAQHVHLLEKVRKSLLEENFEVLIGKGDERVDAKGQILGCNFSAASKIKDEVDVFLFIGSGTFHPLGVLINTKKPVISFDPYTNQVMKKELETMKDKVLRQRYAAIAKSKDAEAFGILIGTKKGQKRTDLALKLKDIIDSNNKKSYFIALDFFSSQFLEGFTDIDCFVSTACSRIAVDDYLSYKKPIITPIELEIVFDKRNWDDYRLDEILS